MRRGTNMTGGFFWRLAIFPPHNQIFFWKVMTQILKGMGIVPAKSGRQKGFNIGKIQRWGGGQIWQMFFWQSGNFPPSTLTIKYFSWKVRRKYQKAWDPFQPKKDLRLGKVQRWGGETWQIDSILLAEWPINRHSHIPDVFLTKLSQEEFEVYLTG